MALILSARYTVRPYRFQRTKEATVFERFSFGIHIQCPRSGFRWISDSECSECLILNAFRWHSIHSIHGIRLPSFRKCPSIGMPFNTVNQQIICKLFSFELFNLEVLTGSSIWSTAARLSRRMHSAVTLIKLLPRESWFFGHPITRLYRMLFDEENKKVRSSGNSKASYY